VAVEHNSAASITKALKNRGIIPDFRSPDIIRLAPIALYNSFHEVWQVTEALKEIIDGGEHKNYQNVRDTIA